ncbi:MAG TPA: PA14 domain-containing protein, partial [Gaiellaceae bacterium]|nr:PA14 domain-containing protein [Gaiellaceae bacterium]
QYEASYYGNTALSGSPILTRCESTIDYDWGDGSPAPGVPADDFSVRWQGTFDFPAGETTFTATADDGIRVWVDGILVIDAWVDQPPTTYTATRTLSAGAHQVRVEYYERGWGAVARLGWGQGGGGGPCAASEYEATYYPNISLAGSPVLTRCEPAVDHSWGTGSPAPVVPVDNFSARWVGSFDFAAGETTFSATADDGIRVFVDDVIVIDAWVDQSPTTYMATRTLSAGTHAVRVEYYERGGGAVAQLSWTTASSAPTIVSRTPAPGATGVGLNVSPSATFSEAMDAGTITATTFTLSRQADSSPVAATVSYDPTTHTATLDPSSDLQPGTGYQATVEGGAGGVTDSSGTPLGADSTWTFTTASAPNQPPAAQISAPTAALTWKVGDAIMFSGQAVDPEQGALPASALSWRLLMQHCPSNCHSHTLQTWAGVASGSFSAPDHEYPSYLELELTATDAQGATDVETVRLDPQTVIISFSTSPSGLELAVNASSQTTPFTRTVISGSTNSVSAPSPQTLAGTTYEFSSWSDGGGQTHNVTAPAGGATYTATYVIAPPRNTTLPVISGQPRVGSTLTVSNGAWTGSQPMSFSYQWLRCSNNALASCTPISGQTASSYVLIAADRRQRIRARVTATNAGGSGQATSSATPPVK